MSKNAKSALPKDFESALAELEELVTAMEGGNLSLEAALAAYKRGMTLTALCQKKLAEAEQQVKVLENDLLRDFSLKAEDSAGDDA